MTDFASLGIEIDTRPIAAATSELDKFAAVGKRVDATVSDVRPKIDLATKSFDQLDQASAQVTQRARSMNGQMDDTTKIMRYQAEQARAAAAANMVLTRDQSDLIQSFDNLAATIGLTRSQLRDLQAYEAGVVAQTQVSRDAINAQAGAFRNGAVAMDGMSFSSAGATRELMVLGHEIISGNFSRLPGSLIVLGERTNAMHAAISALGAGTLVAGAVVVGAVAAIGYAFAEGAAQSSEFAKSVALTGNAAGVTEGQLNGMAAALGALEDAGAGHARTVLQTLISTGQFTGESLLAVGGAALTMSKLTGQSAEEVASDFAKMADGVVKFVDEHEKRYHALSTAQYQHIRQLEEEGKAQQAMTEYGHAVDDALKKNELNLGTLETALNAAKHKWDDYWDAAKGIGRRETPDDTIAKAQQAIISARQTGLDPTGPTRNGGMNQVDMDQFIQKQSDIIIAALKKKTEDEQKAAAASETARRDAEGQRAVRELADMQKRYQTKQQAETDAIRKYKENIEKVMIGGGEIPNDEAQAQVLAGIHAQYAQGKDDRAKVLQDSLLKERAALEGEKSIYDARDNMLALYHTKFATSDADFYAGRANARADYIAAEAISYAKQQALVQAAVAQAKNPEEVAAAKSKYDELVGCLCGAGRYCRRCDQGAGRPDTGEHQGLAQGLDRHRADRGAELGHLEIDGRDRGRRLPAVRPVPQGGRGLR
ncbi:phage tail length tape measure family protein [Duganella sp. BJB1802]|uniref:phage tail length tape measure family protein n=1 Tax=Duganella sp. BJB1802 TaxID=2744575 RepID=UPI001593706D|nr:phage tail length tape measure family protein [Duganella sp. BJB1802]NVD74530.1 phage tail length tape measure family protein [Duganella sp. BJB1802]